MNEVVSVIVASAQSVAKVFVIGAVGFVAVRWPRRAPLLPASAVSIVARFGFHVLVLSLIYSTTAVSVSPNNLSQYWFVVTAAVVVLGVSYATATLLGGGCGCGCGGNSSSKCIRPFSFLHITNPQDFVALRIAITFPNIVALPILIFPSLCEHAVVYENFLVQDDGDATATTTTTTTTARSQDPLQLSLQCADDANAIIFCYFFTWSLLFYSLGHPQLMAAAKQRARLSTDKRTIQQQQQQQMENATQGNDSKIGDGETINRGDDNNNSNVQSCTNDQPSCLEDIEDAGHTQNIENDTAIEGTLTSSDGNLNLSEKDDDDELSSTTTATTTTRTFLRNLVHALRQTFTSPGFLALVLGAITGCIPPLRDALFEPAGPLRFLGDAIQTLARASSPMSTMVVAASLVPPKKKNGVVDDNDNNNKHSSNSSSSIDVTDAWSIENRHNEEKDKETALATRQYSDDNQSQKLPTDNPIMSDPNFGPHIPRRRHRQRRHSSLYHLSASMRRSSANLIANMKQEVRRSNPEQRRLLVWFTLSRLVLSPAIVVGILLGLKHGTALLDSVPSLAQLVVIVNASLPGALIVVVLLKSQPSLSESASAVAQVYLPTYLISIVTIAAWTAVGLWITMPSTS